MQMIYMISPNIPFPRYKVLPDLIIKCFNVSSKVMILTVDVITFNSIDENNITLTLISATLIVFNLVGGKFPLYTGI